MTELRQAAQMALEYLENNSPDALVEVEPHIWEYRGGLVIQALRQALTPEVTPEVTPEGWVKIDEVRKYFDSVGCGTIYKTAGEDRVPLYLAPPKKEWVGLTDEELGKTVLANLNETLWTLTKDIEAKLKEKNT